jgi:Domain of unknown function (DUF2017)
VKKFKATPRGITVTFTHDEAELLANVAGQLEELLGDYQDRAGDAALERLLPDGYRDSAEDAEEFRRFTQTELVDEKVGGARTIVLSLTQRTVDGVVKLTLSSSDAFAWLRSLNDIRLALAARIGIVDESSVPPVIDNSYAIYLWLGQVQYSLLRAVDR